MNLSRGDKQTNTLVRIPGHNNFYKDPRSDKIYFKKKEGKVVYKFSTGVTQITKAKRIAEEKILQIKTSANPEEIKRRLFGLHNPLLENLYMKEFVDYKSPEVLASTLSNYKKSWKHGLRFWHEKYVLDLTDHNIIQFRNWYLANHPTRIFHHTFVHFQSFLDFLFKKKVLKEIPSLEVLRSVDDIIVRNSRRIKPGRVYTEFEISELLVACESFATGYIGIRTKLGILLGSRCGLRKMEALSLKWENLNFKKKEMKIWSTKNSEWRTVPLISEVIDIFKEQKNYSSSSWVFPMPSNIDRHLSSQIFDKGWIKAKKIAGIKGRARFHDLRHTFASVLGNDPRWSTRLACTVLDMSLDIFESVYYHPSQEKMDILMKQTFGGS